MSAQVAESSGFPEQLRLTAYDASAAALMVRDRKAEAADAALVSVDRLRCAVLELFTALNETLRDDRGSAEESLRRGQAILEGVSEHTAPTANSGQPRLAPWQVRRVLVHIDANLESPIRNKDLAAIARLSAFHFNAAFRNSVGDPPHEYIIRRRMERAQGLMLSTEWSLGEIAAECGLADQAHLTRLFRRVVGESPAAWRRARANPKQSLTQATANSFKSPLVPSRNAFGDRSR